MSISKRLGIAWAPDYTTSEPTDTIVLTGKTHFVDQRLFPQLTPNPSPISWAFAGIRSSHPIPERQGYTKCSWTHLVSSVPFSNGEPPTDEGVLGPHPTWPNDPVFSLETGTMVNPDTGLVTDYKEYWQDNPAKEGDEVVFWEYGSDESGPDNRAFLGVVGDHALAVGRIDGIFWTWRAGKTRTGIWELERSVLEQDNRRRGWGLLDFLFETIVPGATTVEDEIVSGYGFEYEQGKEAKFVWTSREAWKARKQE